MNLYQMIFKRRSIRKFKKEPVPEQLLKDILYFGDNIPRLHGDIQIKMEISENPDYHLPVKGLWKVEAPYYLAFYSEEKEGYLANAGYVLEHVVGMESFLLNIVGNIVGFMPCGFFLPVISRRSRRWFNTVLLSFLFSLCIETIQLIFKVGSFDVDDMILNTLGGILGYILYKIVQHIRVRVRRRRRAKAEKSVLH